MVGVYLGRRTRLGWIVPLGQVDRGLGVLDWRVLPQRESLISDQRLAWGRAVILTGVGSLRLAWLERGNPYGVVRVLGWLPRVSLRATRGY